MLLDAHRFFPDEGNGNMYEPKTIKLIPVVLTPDLEIGVHPEVMKELNLKAGQQVDAQMAKRILEEN